MLGDICENENIIVADNVQTGKMCSTGNYTENRNDHYEGFFHLEAIFIDKF